MRGCIQDFGYKLEQRVRREQEFCLRDGARKGATRASLSCAGSFLRPNTSKRLLRRIPPPQPLRRLDPQPISSPFNLKITHSYFFKNKKEIIRPELTHDQSSHYILLYFHTAFQHNYKTPIIYDFLVGPSRLFQSCGWLLGASGSTKGRAVNDLPLSFSFVEQINAGNKIPQLRHFITNRFSQG